MSKHGRRKKNRPREPVKPKAPREPVVESGRGLLKAFTKPQTRRIPK